MGSRGSSSRSRRSVFVLPRVLICILSVVYLSVFTISAVSSETSDTSSSQEGDTGGGDGEIWVPAVTNVIIDEPLEVYTVDPVVEESQVVGYAASSRPFYGSTWIEGEDASLGSGTLYLPINYQSGYLGLTDDGTLVNVSSNSLTGYYYRDSGNVYTVTMAFASTPRYRLSSSYDAQDFLFTPSDGNAVIADSDSNLASVEYLLPFIAVLLIGVIFICLLSKSRS